MLRLSHRCCDKGREGRARGGEKRKKKKKRFDSDLSSQTKSLTSKGCLFVCRSSRMVLPWRRVKVKFHTGVEHLLFSSRLVLT